MTRRNAAEPEQAAPAPVLRLAIAWAIVGLPLLWGVYQTFIKALALFR